MAKNLHTEQIKELNTWMKSIDKKLSNHLTDVAKDITAVQTDLAWIKKFFWVVFTPLVGTLIAAVIGLLLK